MEEYEKTLVTGAGEKKEPKAKKGRFEVEVLDKGFSMTCWMEKDSGSKADGMYPMSDMSKGVATEASEVEAAFKTFMSGKCPF